MTMIPVKKELLEELVDLKLKFLYDEIDKILAKWGYESPTQFLKIYLILREIVITSNSCKF